MGKKKLDKKQLLEAAKQQGRDVAGLNKGLHKAGLLAGFGEYYNIDEASLINPMPITRVMNAAQIGAYEGDFIINPKNTESVTFRTARHYIPTNQPYIEPVELEAKTAQLQEGLAEILERHWTNRLLQQYQVSLPSEEVGTRTPEIQISRDYEFWMETWRNNLSMRLMSSILNPVTAPAQPHEVKPIAHDDIMLDEGVPEVQASATDIEL